MVKKVRLDDIAQDAGVSIATVSRALADNPAVNDDTKRRIWDLARAKGYNMRALPISARSAAKATLSIIVPKPQGREGWLLDPFFQELIGSVGEAARRRPSPVSNLRAHLEAAPPLDRLAATVSAVHSTGSS